MSATNVKVAKFKTWFYWWKMWKFRIRFLLKHVVNNSCFGIFMYKFVCFTMSSKLLCSNNFTQNVKLMNHYTWKMEMILFFSKIQKLSCNILFHPFSPLKRLWNYDSFHFLEYDILCIPKTLWKEFSIPKILFLLQKQ